MFELRAVSVSSLEGNASRKLFSNFLGLRVRVVIGHHILVGCLELLSGPSDLLKDGSVEGAFAPCGTSSDFLEIAGCKAADLQISTILIYRS